MLVEIRPEDNSTAFWMGELPTPPRVGEIVTVMRDGDEPSRGPLVVVRVHYFLGREWRAVQEGPAGGVQTCAVFVREEKGETHE